MRALLRPGPIGSMTFGSMTFGPLTALTLFWAAVAGILALSGPVAARDLFVQPGAAAAADGSREAPYDGIHAALKVLQPGDRILLMAGEYGRIVLNGDYDPPLEIRSETPGAAHAERLFVQKGSGMRISGLALWPLNPVKKPYDLIESRGRDIRFSDLDLRGRADAPDSYFDWSKEDWKKTWRVNGIRLRGPDNAVVDSRFTALAFPIQAMADRNEIRGNHVSGFSGDGLRALGDDNSVIGNFVENSFTVDKNHNDGFQSWATKPDPDRASGKLQKNLRIIGNTILAWTGPAQHPLHRQDSDLQGIVLFDGRYENVTIENNLVVVNQYHGITLLDGYDSRIVNNTVVNSSGKPDKRPWLLVGSKFERKEGTQDVVVANNLAMSYRKVADALRRNAVVRFPAQFFADPLHGDFRPKAGGPLLGAGDGGVAPPEDIEGRPRATGGKVTLGAFEGGS